jgi:dihydropyrimidinase
VIDVAGKYVFPGGVDPSTQFVAESNGEAPSDDFYAGTKASVAGGTTTIIDLVIPQKGESMIEAYDTWRSKADGKAVCDYGLRCGVTWYTMQDHSNRFPFSIVLFTIYRWSKSVSDEMRLLCLENGVNTFNVFTAFKNLYQLNDSELYDVFERCKEIGALTQVHAENGDIIAKNVEKLLAQGTTGPEGHDLSRPAEVEAEAVNRSCVIANQSNSAVYITKVTSKLTADQIASAKRRGVKVFGETLVGSIGVRAPSVPSVYTLTSPPLRLQDPENSKLLLKHLAL